MNNSSIPSERTATGMAGVEEIRAGIALANNKASDAIAALQQAALQLDEARTALMAATEGSGQADIVAAHGLLAESVQTIAGLRATILASITSAEGYAARL
jgi:hypothetical protein